MLAKLGWTEGKGLGKKEDGIVNPVMLRFKQDTEGVGFADQTDNQWTQHDAGFNDLLKRLNGGGDENEEENDPIVESTAQLQSLEERSKKSRSRVHYTKFTRGKDLSQANEKDLANIFGKRSLDELNKPVVMQNDTSADASENYSESGDRRTKVLGLTTIKSSLTIEDYFKEKMKGKQSAGHPGWTYYTPEAVDNADDEQVEPKKKKNKKKGLKYTEITEENGVVGDVPVSEVSPKKGKRKHETSIDVVVENGNENRAKTESMEPKKKKKKSKKTKPDLDEPLSNETNEPEQLDVELSVEQDASELETSKKKKKSKKDKSEKEANGTVVHSEPVTVGDSNNSITLQSIETIKKNKKGKNDKESICTRESETTDVAEVQVPQGKKSKENKVSVPEESSTILQQEPEIIDDAEAKVPKGKKKKSKKNKVSTGIEAEETATTVQQNPEVAANTEVQVSKGKKSKKNKSSPSTEPEGTSITQEVLKEKEAESKPAPQQEPEGKDNVEAQQTDTSQTPDCYQPPPLAPGEKEDDVTCTVKVDVLKHLDETAFPGSNFGNIVGYRLTEDVKLIKKESRFRMLDRHRFEVKAETVSVHRKWQKLKKVTAFTPI